MRPGPSCGKGGPERRYDVVAIDVDITVNRFGDHDPEGAMYVLEADLPRVRQEEAQNARARADGSEPAVSVGLQGDAIQPLTLRVNQGECLRVRLRNDLRGDKLASFHLHGSSLRVARTGKPATTTNPAALVRPGATVDYEWMVGAKEPEGTHYFHSEGDPRRQTSHGLFGAVIVEPEGSTWLDPVDGSELRSGWAAVIRSPKGSDFREFAVFYHEIGNENYQLRDRAEGSIPLVDPLTNAYRPASRALNYRSESFMNRLALQQERTGTFDESVAYSSYAFGDPATPIARSYLGDPVKQRVIHGGSEVAHVHHVHGGAIRWPRQPGVESARFDKGLDKRPPLRPEASERVDSQSIGPSESFDVEDECGSGGCQQSAGDFLFHCHVAQHYFAGMWGIWRVYNTLQNGVASTDALPPLSELPDRRERLGPSVSSEALVGRTVDSFGKTELIEAANLSAWVERQLPPPGVPRGYDASVLDWTREADRYLGEPETEERWPGYQPRAPGARPAIAFDPATGRLAYPFLQPHLGKRPPFAPNHGPAPFLDPATSGTDLPRPGANGPASVCPAGTRTKSLALQAISIPVALNSKESIVDSSGALFVLKDQEDAVRADNGLKTPLAVRANAGEDCVDVLLRSELADTSGANAMSKVSAHIHFVQFDVQASDGINTGFNYEQTVRPFTADGAALTVAAAAGSAGVALASVERFQAGAVVGVGMDQGPTFEVRRIKEVVANTLVFDEPLAKPHGAGEIVSTEFVRYRWYPDVQFGTAYFHDHVNGQSSWQHGLFGALVSEPPGSTYHDPRTGEAIESGAVADIRTDEPVSADIDSSFRELVMFVQDDNDATKVGRSTGSSLNLRVEPLDSRSRGDPSRRFSSTDHGDPATPVLEANLGDPVVVRTLVAGTNEVHTWHLDGHWFRTEPWSKKSAPTDTVHLGISERYDLSVPRAGGPQRMAGDYLYYNGRSFKLREGSWGILRVRARPGRGLQLLPGNEAPPPPAESVCPPGAPLRRFALAAIDVPLPMLGGKPGKVYVLQADKAAVRSGTRPPEPLVLRANVGDCIKVELSNETSAGPVSFHAGMLAADPWNSGGVTAGNNPPQAVAPGQRRTSTFYAHPEVGPTAALVRDFGDVLTNPGLGLYGAIIVGPKGARYRDPVTGKDASADSSWKVDVIPADAPAYRDFALFFQDDDASLGTHRMPYTTKVQGEVGLNYRTAARAEGPARTGVGLDPPTPIMEAFAGDAVKVHVLAPWSEQTQVFSVEGHRWPFEPGRAGTNLLSSVTVGGMEAITAELDGGAGGSERLAGDYVYGNHRLPYREAGQWGIFRVRHPGRGDGAGLRVLPGGCGPAGRPCRGAGSGSGSGSGIALAAVLSLALLGALLGLGGVKRRQDSLAA